MSSQSRAPAVDHRPLKTVAFFGATGMLGSEIFKVLLDTGIPDYQPNVIAILRPGKSLDASLANHPRLKVVHLDFSTASEELVGTLRGVDAVVTVLSGGGVETQYPILEAAIKAGVRRFYPSEFGFHQAYRAPGDPGARIMPLWDEKERFSLHLKLHPAVESGKISFTFIGAGDIYNQKPEPFWCPWEQDQDSYEVPIVGDGDAPADWSHTRDLAHYVVGTLSQPAVSANATLNFPSETISQNAMLQLLQKYAGARGKIVKARRFSEEDAHRFVANEGEAPKEIGKMSAIPVDFYFVVKSIQGSGTFRRSRWECHWDLFPNVRRTTFEEYMQERFGSV